MKDNWFRKNVWFLQNIDGSEAVVIFNKPVNFFRAKFLHIKEQRPTWTIKQVLVKANEV